MKQCLRSGQREWPNPPQFLNTMADAIKLQQPGQNTFPILCELAEKEVFEMVRVLNLVMSKWCQIFSLINKCRRKYFYQLCTFIHALSLEYVVPVKCTKSWEQCWLDIVFWQEFSLIFFLWSLARSRLLWLPKNSSPPIVNTN